MWLSSNIPGLLRHEAPPYTAALHSSDYFVAISWDSWGFPNVGYSNFELDCTANWSDYGDGRWVQNSGVDCSWPMLRITTEVGDPEDC